MAVKVERIDYSQMENREKYQDIIMQYYDHPPLVYTRSYGCQQNVNDGEKIRGVLMDIGFGVCDSVEQADLILFNTCAVRDEKAEGKEPPPDHRGMRLHGAAKAYCG